MWIGEIGLTRRRLRERSLVSRSSDEQLLERVARRETRALEELYRRHAPLLYGVARRFAGVHIAESVTRSSFVQVWTDPWAFAPVDGSVLQTMLARTVLAVPVHARPSADECVWVLLSVGHCTFVQAAALLGVPEAAVRRHAAAAFNARNISGAQSEEPG